MKMKSSVSRREVLKRSLVVVGTASGAAAVFSACGESKSGFSCTDTSGLAPAEKQMRDTLKYVDKSPHADKNCLNCQLWTSGTTADKCGGCQVIKGPIHPLGYCTSWVKQA